MTTRDELSASIDRLSETALRVKRERDAAVILLRKAQRKLYPGDGTAHELSLEIREWLTGIGEPQ